MKLRAIFTLLILFIYSQSAFSQVIGNAEDITIGKKITFHSKILDSDASLSISLPKGYEDSTDKYPVIYIVRNFFHFSSGAVEYLSSMRQIPQMIVVNYTNNKLNEVPTQIKGREKNSGGTQDLMKFMRQELVPYIESNYRTEPYRIVYSQSWGAVFGMYAMLTEPDFYHAAIASSPWLIYDGEEKFMLKNTPEFLKNNSFNGNFLYFSGGDQPELTPTLLEFAELLKQNSPDGPNQLRWEYDPSTGNDHGALPYKTIYDGLKALYAPWNSIPEEIAAKGFTGIKTYLDGIKDVYGYDIKPSSFALGMAGMKYRAKKNYEDALATFGYDAELNPTMYTSYYMMGRCYEDLGDYKKAAKNFEIAMINAKNKGSANESTYRGYMERAKEKIK